MYLNLRERDGRAIFVLSGSAFIGAFFEYSYFLDHRPRVSQPENGFIYQFDKKGSFVYISSIDVNENRLLWGTAIVAMLVAGWLLVALPSGERPVIAEPPSTKITQRHFDLSLNIFVAALFAGMWFFLLVRLCTVFGNNGIVILPPLAG